MLNYNLSHKFRTLPLQIKIFAPLGFLILIAHGAIYFHSARILESDGIFESIIVSILQRNIMGSGLITLIIAFGISYFIAQSIYQDSEDYRAAQEVLKDLNLDSLSSIDLELLNMNLGDESEPETAATASQNTTKESTPLIQNLIHPLAGILGHVQLALMKTENDDLRQNLKFIEEETRKIKKQIEDFNINGKLPDLPQLAVNINAPVMGARVQKQARLKIGRLMVDHLKRFPEFPPPLDLPEQKSLEIKVRRPQLKGQAFSKDFHEV